MTIYKTDIKSGALDNQVIHYTLQSDLCHELRTPLIGILGFSELLMEDKGANDVTEMATKINICGMRLLEFIDKLLTVPVNGLSEVDEEMTQNFEYSEEQLRIFRIELLHRFQKLAANGE